MTPPDIASSNDQRAEAKLWLDYLGKLKDRADRAQQLTGISNWVLYSLVGTLLYKGSEFFPALIANPEFRHNTEVLAILGLNICIFGQQVLGEMAPAVKGNRTDVRDSPENLKSLLWLLISYAGYLFGVLGIFELFVWRSSRHAPFIVKSVLLVFGIFHVSFFLLLTAFFVWKRRIESQHSIRLHTFTAPSAKSSVNKFFSFTCTLLALAAASSFTTSIASNSPDWLLSTRIALGILVILWAAKKLLIVQPTQEESIVAITSLERRILLEDLKGPDIRKLFMERVVGMRLSDWSEENSNLIATAYINLDTFIQNANEEVRSVCLSTGPERLGRVEALENKLKGELAELNKGFAEIFVKEGTLFATNLFFTNLSVKEAVKAVFNKKKQMTDISSSIRELLQKLEEAKERTPPDVLSLGDD